MTTYKIAVIGGDGTGPEVIREAVKVLHTAEEKFGFKLDLTELDYNGSRYLKTGQILDDAELEELRRYDAILLGAIGHPDITPGLLERGILLKIRFGLDQYINLRPVRLYENVYTPIKNKSHQDIDYVVVRENTGGLYTGVGGSSMTGTVNEVAVQSMVYSYHQVERCLRFAFEQVMQRHVHAPWKGLTESEISKGFIGKLTLCGKTNVLGHVFGLWERVMNELSAEFPRVKTDYVHVDAMCIYMIECPERFDVIVTENMFGDIITDLAAVTQGGMGVASSGNINPNGVSMFEPIGGTAPAFTGRNEINPMAAIGAAHMMLAHLAQKNEAGGEVSPQGSGAERLATVGASPLKSASTAIEMAKINVIKQMRSMAAAQMGFSTTQIGDMVAEQVQSAVATR
ncbi:3-isopropylmalate dehydrogenase [bacterium]|nr:3-isopropylmalate dehydrogenase [bacterium]